MNDDLIAALIPLLANIVDDWELQPEIRNNAVTIYYRGAALIRELRLGQEGLVGQVHRKYVPIDDGETYVPVVTEGGQLSFQGNARPLELGDLAESIVREYKLRMRAVAPNPEKHIVHGIVSRRQNRIIDQELKFAANIDQPADKIDLCYYDQDERCLGLVEVKQFTDLRLAARGDEIPEVIGQLQRYQRRLETNHQQIIAAKATTVEVKRRLGFGARVEGVPAGPIPLFKKPLLVIGGCTQTDVDNKEQWENLLTALKPHTTDVILCGEGCTLRLRPQDGGDRRDRFEPL